MCVLSFNFMPFRYLLPEQGWSYAVISTKREIYTCISVMVTLLNLEVEKVVTSNNFRFQFYAFSDTYFLNKGELCCNFYEKRILHMYIC